MDEESECSEDDDSDYVPQGVQQNGAPAIASEDSDETSEEEGELPQQDNRRSKNGRYWSELPPVQGRAQCHNIFRSCPGIAPGPAITSPKDAFCLFITDNIIDEILMCTNLEGRRTAAAKGKTWKDVTRQELMAFFGLTLLAGSEKSWDVSSRELFSDPLFNPMYKTTMGLSRFEEILRFLRFDDKRTQDYRLQTDHMAAFR